MRSLCLALAFAGTSALAQEVTDPGSPEAGEDVYSVFCQSCHGAAGRGDGDFADLLSVQPADLTQLAARNGGEFPQVEVMRQIDGRARVEGHGVIMPVFGPLFDLEVAITKADSGQPIVTSRSIADLAAFIESIQEE
ncbi:cytochrome C [Roseivivax halodurans JCM 10272]|uniref:Cytochrome C n=1 Tax=Roseivivax halodurans JCM 10272 TaxID=1449350 RepID=X7EFK4_9RHOB|nr:c-type cytochrome [Roseivivax halodurans]ETX14727.1 cytochrome C [Roseivivax halodurans JCM 10272]